MNTKNSKTKTHFGFKQIDSEDKKEKVREVFDNVVEGYKSPLQCYILF